MNFYSIKYLMLTKKKKEHSNKTRNSGKINLYFHCIDFGFKTFTSIDKVELIYLLKGLSYLIYDFILLFNAQKNTESKNLKVAKTNNGRIMVS